MLPIVISAVLALVARPAVDDLHVALDRGSSHPLGVGWSDPVPPRAPRWVVQAIDAAVRFGQPAESEYFLLVTRAGDPEPPSGEKGSARPAAARRATGRALPASTRVDGGDTSVGVVALRRIVRPWGTLLEREVIFREGGVRVLHTERVEGTQRRLVWREFLPMGGRTWMADWNTEGEGVRTTGYGWSRPVHERRDAPAGLRGPLELLDGFRRDGEGSPFASGDEWMALDPAAACAVAVRANVSGDRIELLRTDGSLLMAATRAADAYGEGAIAGVRFHEGPVEGEPIDAAEYARRRARWLVRRVPAHEAVLAVIPDRR